MWPVPAIVVVVLLMGALCGLLNGLLVGYLRLRAFLTTLVTLIIFRSIYEIVFLRFLDRSGLRHSAIRALVGFHRQRHASSACRCRWSSPG